MYIISQHSNNKNKRKLTEIEGTYNNSNFSIYNQIHIEQINRLKSNHLILICHKKAEKCM